jgi:glycerophosphoryl diester phosphodiesterase
LIIPKAKYQTLVPSYICTLDKYLDICQNYNKAPIIELKQPNLTELQLINLLTKVKTNNLFTSSSFISFNFSTLDLLKKIDPQTITYNLIDSKFNQNGLGKRGIIEAINSQCNVSIRAILASQRMIDLIHAHKLLVSI